MLQKNEINFFFFFFLNEIIFLIVQEHNAVAMTPLHTTRVLREEGKGQWEEVQEEMTRSLHDMRVRRGFLFMIHSNEEKFFLSD